MWMRMTFFSFLLFIQACGSCDNNKESAEAENTQSSKAVAALVNGSELLTAELDQLHQRATEQLAKTNQPISSKLDRQIRGSILSKMIDDELCAQKAKELKIDIDRFKRVEALENYKTRMGGEKGFKLFLEQQKLTEAQIIHTVTADMTRNMLVEKLGNLAEPSEKEIAGFYRANQQLFAVGEMVRARHILLKVSENEGPEKAELVLKKATQIKEEALQANASFADLAKKYSESPNGKDGGDLGFFPQGRMVKVFDDAAFSAPLKTAVGPIRTEFGYHIIYVEEKSAAKTASLDEARDRIVESLTKNKMARQGEEMLKGLRKKAQIKINDYSMTAEEYGQLFIADQAKGSKEKG